MAKINTTNYQPVTAWNGTQDLLIVEQPDGTKVATPEQVKQYVEAGDFEATGEVKDGHGNILKNVAERIATKVEGSVFPRTDDTSLTAKMDNIKAQNKSGAYVMYCSSNNPDFSTIGYCTAIGLTINGAVSVIAAVNSQTGEVWTNGNTSKNAGAWRGWKKVSSDKRPLTVSPSVIGSAVNVANATSTNPYTTPHEGFVRFGGPSCLTVNTYRIMKSSANEDYKGMWLPKGATIYFTDGTPPLAQWFNCSNE